MSHDTHHLSLAELSVGLRNKTFSATELAQHFLARAQASELNTFIDINPELTMAQARAADDRLASGESGPLLGIPLAHKDIFVTRGWRSTAGSRMLDNYVSPFDATVVARLAAAGTVCLGKLNCDEFAMGSGNENLHYGPAVNPWGEGRVPGGSSGGSAAAVAAGLAPVVTATDTGGSVRQPASMCNVTGIKPTYGRVSRYGMIAFASSLDQAGVIGRSAADCAVALSAIAGFDERDSTSIDRPAEDFARDLDKPLAGLRVGLPNQFFGDGLAGDVGRIVHEAIDKLVELGATTVAIDLADTELAIPAYYVIAPAEASSNLSRFDGVRYGFRADGYEDLNDMYEKTRAQGFGTEVKRRILVGTFVLSHGYYDAYYRKAQQLRRRIAQGFEDSFEQVDVIAGPVSPTTAWAIGERKDDPVSNYLADIYTLPASLAGLPGLSVPAGFGDNGLPVGLQLMGNYYDEARLLNVAHQYQQVTDWHRQYPSAA